VAAAAPLGPDMKRSSPLLMALLLGWALPLHALTEVLIVTGLAGDAQFEQTFPAQSEAMKEAFARTGANVSLLAGEDARREGIKGRMDEYSRSLTPDDRLIVVYVGHGSYDGRQFKFNLPGPDLSAREAGAWLDDIAAWQLMIIASSASGAALDVLSDERRTLMTATRSGEQSNVTVFGDYLVQALHDRSADVNKDEKLSLDEVFQFTQRAVADHYEQRRLMATEHPQLVNARALFTLNRLPPPTLDPALAALVSRRDGIESAIETLKDSKSGMAPDAYFQELQQLLLELALVQQELEREGGAL
jgi:hypothetical protein